MPLFGKAYSTTCASQCSRTPYSYSFLLLFLLFFCLVDLKAFERRLTEVIGYLNPQTKRWRVILFLSSICTAIGAWQWLMDPITSQASFVQSLMNHMFFTISSIILVILFLMGIHKRVVTPSIIVSRVRNVLSDFNMSCDDGGRLILRPRPTSS